MNIPSKLLTLIYPICAAYIQQFFVMKWVYKLKPNFNFTWKMVLKWVFFADSGKDLAMHIHCWGLLRDRAHWMNTMVLFGRWSWKYHSLVTLEKQMYIHYSGVLGDRACWGSTIPLLRIWSWKGYLFVRQSFSSQYNSFTWKMFLKKLFISDAGEDFACSLFRSPRSQSSLSQYSSFT